MDAAENGEPGVQRLKTIGEPGTRLPRLGKAMCDVLAEHPDHGDERCIVLLHEGDQGAMTIRGYEPGAMKEALQDLLGHLRAFCEANGVGLAIKGVDLED